MKIISETEKKKGEIEEEMQVLTGLVQKGKTYFRWKCSRRSLSENHH